MKGYVQGMNDLVSIFLIVMDGNEPDAFWCFKGLMDKIVRNFIHEKILFLLFYIKLYFND